MAEEMAGRLDAAAEQGRNAAAARGNAAGRQPLVAVPRINAAPVNENAAERQQLVAVVGGNQQGNAAAAEGNAARRQRLVARGNAAGGQPLVAVPQINAAPVNENAAERQRLVAVLGGNQQGNAAAAEGNAARRQRLVAVAAGVAAAPVAVMAPINMAVQPGLVQPRFNVEAALAGPTPRKSNMNCKIHARIDDGP